MMDLKGSEEGWVWILKDRMWHIKYHKYNIEFLNLIYP